MYQIILNFQEKLMYYMKALKVAGVYHYVAFATGICLSFLSLLLFAKSNNIILKTVSLFLAIGIIYLTAIMTLS